MSLSEEQYEKKFLSERKDFITYECQNSGILICDNRYRDTITHCRPFYLVKSKKWKDAYLFLELNGFLKTKSERR